MTDGKYVYYNDSNMQSIARFEDYYKHRAEAFILPPQVKCISGSAFESCEATAFLLPDGLEEICSYAFAYCENLEAVYIPKSVKVIYGSAFKDCKKLTIYCEGEPSGGWIAEEPRYETQYVTTAEDYAFDFHRGGVSGTSVDVDVSSHWNKDKRPVITNVPREEFLKIFNKFVVHQD